MATTTMTHAAPRVMTIEVPLGAGDVLRAVNTSAVPPPGGASPPRTSPPPANSAAKKSHRRTSSAASDLAKSHRRTSSAASDMAKAAGIDIEAVSMTEARKIMSEEHKILGFRPPQGSFAAEVQSVAARHPDGKPGATVDTSKLKEIAREDALRILAERKTNTGADKDAQPKLANGHDKHAAPSRHSPPDPSIDLNAISASDARILMSHEHRALGFRPPPGSLAAEAQSAAARHPEGDGTHLDDDTLREIAVRDAERIKADRELTTAGGDTFPAKSDCQLEPDMNREQEQERASSAERERVEVREEEEGVQADASAAAASSMEDVKEALLTTTAGADTLENGSAGRTKTDKAVATEGLNALQDSSTMGPPLVRKETSDSVEIVCDILA